MFVVVTPAAAVAAVVASNVGDGVAPHRHLRRCSAWWYDGGDDDSAPILAVEIIFDHNCYYSDQ